jgi:hypothetical protein
VRASSTASLTGAGRHRLSIDRWFYPGGPEMHAGLAHMSEADARFGENIDTRAVALLARKWGQSHRIASYQRVPPRARRGVSSRGRRVKRKTDFERRSS